MRYWVFVSALVVAGCGSIAGDAPPTANRETSSLAPATKRIADLEAGALAILEDEDARAWSWRRGATKRPTHVAGRSAPLLGRGPTTFAATTAFLRRFEASFRIPEPAAHLRIDREDHDELGMTHLRLQQVERGVPVLGGELMVHYDAAGSLRTLDSTYVDGVDQVDVIPTMTSSDAIAIAERHFSRAYEIEERNVEVDTEATLVVHVPASGTAATTPKLAYHLDLRSPRNVHLWVDYAIDAHTGEVIESYNKVMSALGSGLGTSGASRPIEITQDGSTYQLIDLSRTPNGIETYDAKNKGVEAPGIGLIPGTGSLPGELVTSSSATSGWDSAAVDAHYYAGVTYDFYKTAFGRKGVDDTDRKIVSSVHVLESWNNAQWAEYDGKQMLYGDGDGVKFGPLSGALDVVAHELTHGVTFSTSKLRYVAESGALNESMSDIFGSLVEHYGKPHPQDNWGLAEDILLGEYKGKYARDLAHPGAALAKQPAHMSEYKNATDDTKTILDLGGVHINSGIPNNAFYLMTMGGKNDVSGIEVKAGLDWAKSAQVWYRSNTKYLTSTSGFAAAAEANLSAARDLGLTDNEKNIIQCAWIAVGVLEGECAAIAAQPVESDGGPASSPAPSASNPPANDGGSAEAPSDPPAPESGCNVAHGPGRPATGIGAVALGLLALFAARRRPLRRSGS